ncbi:MAG: DUF2628 domain-containing protein [Gemmatimonas sp.]
MSSHDSGTPNPDRLPPDSSGKSGSSAPQDPVPHNELPRWATKQAASTPFSDARMAAYIGPKWESTYRAKLSRFFEDPSFVATWNWAAALGSPFWFLYRKLYLAFILFCALPNVALLLLTNGDPPPRTSDPESPEVIRFVVLMGAVALSSAIAAGGTANWFLFRRARVKSLVVSMQQLPEDVAVSRLQRLGGVSLRPVVVFWAVIIVMQLLASSMGAP